jgi:hypothetical protein
MYHGEGPKICGSRGVRERRGQSDRPLGCSEQGHGRKDGCGVEGSCGSEEEEERGGAPDRFPGDDGAEVWCCGGLLFMLI